MGSPRFSDENVASFCAVTGADDDAARHFLSAAEGDVEVAVSLFLDNPTTPVARAAADTAPSSARPGGGQEEPVRAPIQPRRHRLVEDFGYDEDGGYEPQDYPRDPPAAFAAPIEPFRNFQTEGGPFSGSGRMAGLDDRGRRLAELFRAPTEIMFVGTFDMARRRAREEERYLLVTLHDPAEFPCQQMVRDVWNDSSIQEYVRESLVFQFLTVGTAEAQRYRQYYPVEGFPHWALIDPRTGKRVKSGNKVLKAAEMLMELVEYVCDHPLVVVPSETSSSASSAVSSRRRDSPVSLESLRGEALHSSVEEEERSLGKARTMPLPEEPAANDPAAITVQLRLPDGSRHRRRFLRSDKVQLLFDVVLALNHPSLSEAHSFDIQAHTQSLAVHKDDVLENHNLKNATLTVVPLDVY